MKMIKPHLYLKFCILLLTIGLLFGCTRSAPRPTLESTASAEQIPTTADDKQTEVARQSFEAITNKFFRDQITASMIDLHFTLKDPEAYGITDVPASFGEFSLEEMKKDLETYKQLKEALDEINPELLSSDQQLTYQILYSCLEKEIALEGFELYHQPLAPTIGVQAQLPVLLAEYVFYNKQDVENYLSLLAEIDTYFQQLIDFEKQKSLTGLFMNDHSVDQIIASCSGYLVNPSESFLVDTFDERLATLEGLSETEIADYKARNIKTLEEDFVPAYRYLVDELALLKGTGKNELGLSYYPNGTQYYENLVQSSISPSYETIDELKKAIENQMNSDFMSIVAILKENPSVLDELDTYQFSHTDPHEILDLLSEQVKADFPALPECNYTVKYVPAALEPTLSPAFYLTPPLDQFENNVIYINNGYQNEGTDLFPMLAHEGYPGHLYQTVYFTSNNNSDLRRILPFSSYSEGWAVYVENYSYELDNGLNPALGKVLSHNSASMLGLHALLELNINYYGWTLEQATEYLSTYYEITDEALVADLYQVLIANPTNYLEYYVGYMEIVTLRNKAQAALKDNFNLKEFHTFVLDIGPAPFDIINEHFEIWLQSQK